MTDAPLTDNTATAVTEPAAWAGFSKAWERGFREIIAIRLVRGRVEPQVRMRKRPAAVARWLGFAYGPTLIGLVLPLGADPAQRSILLLLLGTINAGMCAAATLAWRNGLTKATMIDRLLHASPHRDTVPAIVHRGLDLRWQVVPPVAFALLPWVIALANGSFTRPTMATLALVTNLSWTLFLLGNVTYWLAVPPWLVVRMRSWSTLSLRWNDPARTPGLRALSEGYGYAGLFLALGAGVVTLPGMLGIPVFGPYLPFIYALLLALSGWVGVATQAFIYAIVRRFRLRLLDELAKSESFYLTENRSAEIVTSTNRDLSDTLAVYGAVAGAAGLPYGTALVVQYCAAVVGSITGVLLQ